MALSPTWRKLAQCVHGLFGRSNNAGPPTWTMASRLDSWSNLPKGGTVSFRWEARYGACMASLFPRSSLTGGSPLPATTASTRAVEVYRIQHHAVGRCWARRPYGGGRLRRPDTEVPTHSPGGGSEAADRKRGTPSGGRVRVTV
jgi:hypothetical protein